MSLSAMLLLIIYTFNMFRHKFPFSDSLQRLNVQIGDRVCVKRSVAEPRYAWGGETHHSVGTISEIESDGLLIIEIPNRPIAWQADPSDMEKVEQFKVCPMLI